MRRQNLRRLNRNRKRRRYADVDGNKIIKLNYIMIIFVIVIGLLI